MQVELKDFLKRLNRYTYKCTGCFGLFRSAKAHDLASLSIVIIGAHQIHSVSITTLTELAQTHPRAYMKFGAFGMSVPLGSF